MKRKTLILTSLLVLAGCGGQKDSTSTSIEGDSSNPPVTSTSPSSDSTPTSDSTPSSDSTPTSEDTSTSSDPISTSVPSDVVNIANIEEAYQKGASLQVGEVGELVKFTATYMNTLTWHESSEDIMILADNTGSIGLHVPYSSYNGYLANRYTNYDYTVTANIKNTMGQIELVLNSTLSVQDSFVNVAGDPSVDLSQVSEHKNSIADIINEFKAIPLNNKKFGYGKIVSFDAQVVATEYGDSGKKAVFFDGTNCVTLVSDSKVADKTDVGKSYHVYGVLSVNRTSPALWYLGKSYITPTNPEDETTIDVSNAVAKTASSFKNQYIVGDTEDWKIPTYEEYMTLYTMTGYVVDDTSRSSKYYIGMVDTANGSLSDSGISTSISGFFLMNHQGLTEAGFSYSPFYNYFSSETPVTIYYTMQSFAGSNHGWNMFALESLVEPVELQ